MRSALGPPAIERVLVPIAGLRPGLEGLRIVQISDLHIGETLHAPWARRVAQAVNRLEPDVVAITGDLADGSAARLGAEVAPLGEIRSRLGTFFVTGNHEYYNGAPGWEEQVRRLGITVLHNEHRVLTRGGDALVVAGVTDYEGGRFSAMDAPRPDLAFAGAPDRAPRILLAHQPRAAYAAAPFRVDLQLSGHTHGGQIFPWMFFVRLQQPVLRGLRTVGGVRVYTHRGTGFWGPPVRVGASAEIACLTLTRA
jgi:predicted MPP superfamily phosphohydrolase